LASEAPRSKPNVLFIVVDDLKPLLGCYGASWIQSPNIDRLAARGTLFTAGYCQVSFCAPSRMSVLTGLRPDSTHVFFNPTQPQDILRTRFPDLVTLPQQFRNHGYITHPLHKVFDGRTVDAGHDHASWSVPYGPWEMAPGELPAPGGYQDPATKARLAEAAKQGGAVSGPATEGCDIADHAYHDGGVAITAAKRIREFSGKPQPFFLAIGFVKPHLPFIAPKKYWDLYDRASLPLSRMQAMPHGSPHDLAFYSNSGELRSYSNVPKTGAIPESLQRELIHGYAACVSYIDAQIGLLERTLEETGIAENTVICLWGDHGWHLGEHGHWGKVTNYEDATRAPLLIATPQGKQTPCVSSPVELLDIYPTLCELSGLPVPQHIEGRSLVPLLRGEKTMLHKAAISQMSPGPRKDGLMGWALRTPRYRYIEWRHSDLSKDTAHLTNQIQSIELYDTQSDAGERENLAAHPAHLAALTAQQHLFDQLLPHLPKASR
jgi:arylsulfatase A-like enzyme